MLNYQLTSRSFDFAKTIYPF